MKGRTRVGFRRGIVFLATAALLVTATAALAGGSRKLPQKGTVDGDAGASVRLVVINQGGEPKSVKGIDVKELLADCDGGQERIELNLYGAAEVSPSRGAFDRKYGSPDVGVVHVSGKVSNDGKKVSAHLSGDQVQVAGVGTCNVPTIDFETKR